jgi:hypothetical protein
VLSKEEEDPMIERSRLEQRACPRAKISLGVRSRPSQPMFDQFDEVLVAMNSSRSGCYFITKSALYKKRMRLFVSMRYSDVPGAINRDYFSEVLRVDELKDRRIGVAVKFLMPISLTVQDQHRQAGIVPYNYVERPLRPGPPAVSRSRRPARWSTIGLFFML